MRHRAGAFSTILPTHYPLPADKILALFKLKAFADDNFYGAHVVQFFSDRAENILGKEENAGFLLFPECFRKVFSSGVSKVFIVW